MTIEPMCLPVKPYKIEKEWLSHGLKCAVTLPHKFRHRCGYVRVPPSHPLFHALHDDDSLVDVHGGVTLTELEPCVHEDGQGLWLGFDCGHAGDALYDPAANLADCKSAEERFSLEMGLEMQAKLASGPYPFHEHWWSHDEVVAECERLAAQISDLTQKGA